MSPRGGDCRCGRCRVGAVLVHSFVLGLVADADDCTDDLLRAEDSACAPPGLAQGIATGAA